MKLKFNFCDKAIRLLVMKKENKHIVIPIYITDKNDKKYWYNMTWKNIKNNVVKIVKDINLDIENEKYEIF